MDMDKVAAMLSWPTRRNIRIARILGLTSYYQKFVWNYTNIARPLIEQLKKDAFGWNEEAEAAFKELQRAMAFSQIFSLPDFSKKNLLKMLLLM